jgi:cell division protein FtsB
MWQKINITKYRALLTDAFRKFQVKVPLDVVISVVFLSAVLAIVAANFVKRIEEGKRDYDVYLAEQVSLNKLKAENLQLKAELNYYNSLEYKLLYARDSLNKVRPGERLYELSNEIVLYNINPEPVKIYNQLNLIEVWRHLLFAGLMQ